MTSPVSLEALLRRMSRDAEKIFNKCGEVPMLWLLETADGEQKMLTTPLSIPPGMSPGDYKHHLDASLRDLFAREHVVRWSPGRPVRSWRFHYVAGIGRFDDGRLAEVFLTLPKPATAVEALARDAAIAASLALQYGRDEAAAAKKKLRRLEAAETNSRTSANDRPSLTLHRNRPLNAVVRAVIEHSPAAFDGEQGDARDSRPAPASDIPF